MYYYIFEPASNQKDTKFQDEVKEVLQNQSIVGEIVTLSLAEKPEDLAKVGIRKNFNTIIAVGSDSLINEVGNGLIGTDAVLGAIPLETKSDFYPIIGAKDYIEASQILPQRKVLNIDTGIINQKKSFITKIRISPKGRRSRGEGGLVIINFDNNFQAETQIRDIFVSNVGAEKFGPKKTRMHLQDEKLDVFIPDEIKPTGNFIEKIFSKPKMGKNGKGSIFHPKQISIASRKKIEVWLGNKIVERGNLTVEIVPKSIKIIIKRERPKKDKEESDGKDAKPQNQEG